VPIYIPLLQLTDLGRVERWPMAKSGDTTLRLELEPPSNFTVGCGIDSSSATATPFFPAT
jgi:hypothetical protein